MKYLSILTVFCLCAAPATGAETLRSYSWENEMVVRGVPGEVERSDNKDFSHMLRVFNPNPAGAEITVLTIDNPGVTNGVYAISGTIRTEDVRGIGFAQMSSYFPDGTQYFTKTLASSGPMKSFTGTEKWRPFVAAFSANNSSYRPNKITVSITFPGSGTVCLGPLALKQYDKSEDPFAISGAWWGDRTAGWIGGISGSIAGLTGAFIGLLAAMGKGRRIVSMVMWLSIAMGVILTVFGIVALTMRQPFAVWYGPLLVGVILATVLGFNLRTIRRRYDDLELRRMAALDAR
jgi:hypothetical protein